MQRRPVQFRQARLRHFVCGLYGRPGSISGPGERADSTAIAAEISANGAPFLVDAFNSGEGDGSKEGMRVGGVCECLGICVRYSIRRLRDEYAEQAEMSNENRITKRCRGREKGATSDHERGLRFAEETANVFKNAHSRTARAREIGFGESSFRQWEDGANIDNRALAELMRKGADVRYILTGERESQEATDRRALCAEAATHLELLAVCLQKAFDDSVLRADVLIALQACRKSFSRTELIPLHALPKAAPDA